ncbi:VgrG-related protein [Micromonospora sp. WMMD712]|uniref:VgrG-related protein n=1 Tax=Micromonospora sp. WMMD712 TaxID=3016096 RepID=UPI00249CF474|nr:VgrG-related protein [Micromonospora sp. WMMD712]WFE58501.1 VgrG-related protein [Micromonospora sp. WMMD712]
MSSGDHTNNLVVGLPGALPRAWADRLVSAVVEDSTNLAATATLRFRDQQSRFLRDNGVTIGTDLTVRVRTGRDAAPLPLFAGEVVTLESEYDGVGTFTTVRALDLSHRLMRGQRVRSFVNRKASDIAREVAAAAGIPVGRVDPTPTVYETVTQPNVDDWEFLKMLAVDNDAEVVVVDGRFFFRRSVRAAAAPGAGVTAEQSPFVVEMNENLLSVRSTVTSVGQVAGVTVRGWDVRAKRPVRTEVATDASDEVQIGTTPAKVAQPFGTARLCVADVPYRTAAETRAVAGAVAADVTAAFAELEVGIRGNPRLRAGVPLSLQQVGAPFEGKYTITASRHVFGPAQLYETWLTVSGRQDRSTWGLATGATAPARAARIPGLAVAIVTNTKADVDRRHPERVGQGWVRLRFPWLTDAPDYETDWVRTVQLGGVGGGGVFCPEVNDEVLVGFEQGLLDRPYVIGGLYNGVDKPSVHEGALVDGSSGRINRRSLASRRGDRIEFLESALPSGPRGIRLTTARDRLTVHLDDRRTAVVVHSDGSVEIEARQQVTVKGRGITLDAGAGELTLKGRSVSIDGGTQVDIQAPLVKLN